MKKLQFVSLIAALGLLLGGCGSAKVQEFDPGKDAKTLLESGAFSEALSEVNLQAACDRYGIDAETVTAGAVYASAGLTAEELAVFTFDSADHAEGAAKALGYWLEDQTESMADYLPDEVPKLKDGVIETRGGSVLLAVCGDYEAIETFLAG